MEKFVCLFDERKILICSNVQNVFVFLKVFFYFYKKLSTLLCQMLKQRECMCKREIEIEIEHVCECVCVCACVCVLVCVCARVCACVCV